MDTNPDLYSELCTIEVNLSHLWNTTNVQTILKGSGVYYKVSYELIMLFGGTEIEAQLSWKENGIEKRSPAKVLYTDNLPKESGVPLSSASLSPTTGTALSSIPGTTLDLNEASSAKSNTTTTPTTASSTEKSKKSKTDDKCVHQ